MTKFINSLDDATKSNSGKVESQFRKTCKATKGDDNRFVWNFYNVLPSVSKNKLWIRDN